MPASIGLANVIHRERHGAWAEEIGRLAPAILPALPLDPFTGKDYLYRKENGGFVVYSVGENLVDDGGVDRFSAEGRETGSTDIVWGVK